MNIRLAPMPSRPIRTLISVAVLLFIAACGGEQDSPRDDTARRAPRDTVVIDASTPSCTTCAIEVSAPVHLGTPTDREIPQRVPDILRDSRGNHYLVFNGWSDKPVLSYDSIGRFVGKIGSTGQGPGEYDMTTRVLVTPGDSLLLILPGRRGLVFAPDGSYARLVQMTAARYSVFAAAPDGTGGMLAMGDAYRREADTSWAPHVIRLAPDGAVQDSFPIFSVIVGTSTMNRGMPSERQIALRISGIPSVAPDGSIWTIVDGTRLERHAIDGTPRQLIGLTIPGRQPPLMTRAQVDSLVARRAETRPSARRAPVSRTGRPVSLRERTTLSVDSAGMLWIVRTIPAPRHDTITVKPQYLSPDEAPGEATIPRDVEDRLYHTVVEVIDPKGPALLARTELPFQGHVAAPGYIGRVNQDDSGHYVSSIYRLVLRRR